LKERLPGPGAFLRLGLAENKLDLDLNLYDALALTTKSSETRLSADRFATVCTPSVDIRFDPRRGVAQQFLDDIEDFALLSQKERQKVPGCVPADGICDTGLDCRWPDMILQCRIRPKGCLPDETCSTQGTELQLVGYSNRENPRLCRCGSSSLTILGVHPETLRREPPSARRGKTGWTSMTA
jgi:hypothetical protein